MFIPSKVSDYFTWKRKTMSILFKPFNLFLIAIAVILGAGYSSAQKPDEAYRSNDISKVSSLAIGKWMIAPDKLPARWLDSTYLGKSLREPINIIIVDEIL